MSDKLTTFRIPGTNEEIVVSHLTDEIVTSSFLLSRERLGYWTGHSLGKGAYGTVKEIILNNHAFAIKLIENTQPEAFNLNVEGMPNMINRKLFASAIALEHEYIIMKTAANAQGSLTPWVYGFGNYQYSNTLLPVIVMESINGVEIPWSVSPYVILLAVWNQLYALFRAGIVYHGDLHFGNVLWKDVNTSELGDFHRRLGVAPVILDFGRSIIVPELSPVQPMNIIMDLIGYGVSWLGRLIQSERRKTQNYQAPTVFDLIQRYQHEPKNTIEETMFVILAVLESLGFNHKDQLVMFIEMYQVSTRRSIEFLTDPVSYDRNHNILLRLSSPSAAFYFFNKTFLRSPNLSNQAKDSFSSPSIVEKMNRFLRSVLGDKITSRH